MRVWSQEIRRAESPNVFVDFASAAPSRNFRFRNRQEIGYITLADIAFEPNEGAYVEFSKMTAAIQSGDGALLQWQPPESGRVQNRIVDRGRIHVADVGVPMWKRWDTSHSIFAFAMEDSFVAEIARNAFGGSCNRAIETSVGTDDPIIERLMALARCELIEEGVGGRLYVEGLASSLAVHLLRKYGISTHAANSRKGGLTPAQLRRVVEYICAHLGNELGLVELAAIAGLSPHHFGEAFKASSGIPPHRFVIERRVQEARKMLLDGERALGEIAYAVGFSSQAHLTTNFRRVIGITPGRFRRSLD